MKSIYRIRDAVYITSVGSLYNNRRLQLKEMEGSSFLKTPGKYKDNKRDKNKDNGKNLASDTHSYSKQ